MLSCRQFTSIVTSESWRSAKLGAAAVCHNSSSRNAAATHLRTAANPNRPPTNGVTDTLAPSQQRRFHPQVRDVHEPLRNRYENSLRRHPTPRKPLSTLISCNSRSALFLGGAEGPGPLRSPRRRFVDVNATGINQRFVVTASAWAQARSGSSFCLRHPPARQTRRETACQDSANSAHVSVSSADACVACWLAAQPKHCTAMTRSLEAAAAVAVWLACAWQPCVQANCSFGIPLAPMRTPALP